MLPWIKLLLICLCIRLDGSEESAYSQYISYVEEIEVSFANQIHNELGLYWSGASHSMHEKIEQMGMNFQAERRATIDEARAQALYTLNRFLKIINENEKIQPYLEERPFKMADISIRFKGVNGPNSDGSVSDVFNVTNQNKLIYYAEDPFTFHSQKLLEESYEEAQRLNAASSVDPAVHKTIPGEEEMDDFLIHFIDRMAEKYKLQTWSIGAKMDQGLEELGARFTAFQTATVEEARKLILDVTGELHTLFNEEAKLKPFLKESPPSLERLKIHISFTDDNYCPYRNGSMESVELQDRNITYFQDPPLKEGEYFPAPTVKPVFAQESYEEAINKATEYKKSLWQRFKEGFSQLYEKIVQLKRKPRDKNYTGGLIS